MQTIVYSIPDFPNNTAEVFAVADGDDPFLFDLGQTGQTTPRYYDPFTGGFSFVLANERFVYDSNGIRNIFDDQMIEGQPQNVRYGFSYEDGLVFAHEFAGSVDLFFYANGGLELLRSFDNAGSFYFNSTVPFFESGSAFDGGFVFEGPGFASGIDLVISDGTSLGTQDLEQTPSPTSDNFGYDAQDFVTLDGSAYYYARVDTGVGVTPNALFAVEPGSEPQAVTTQLEIALINDIEASGDAIFLSGVAETNRTGINDNALFLYREDSFEQIIDTSLGLGDGKRARPEEMTGFKDGALFRADFRPDPNDFSAAQPDLFFTDGTQAGTTQLASAADIGGVRQIVAGDAIAYVLSTDGALWRTDGTAAGTVQVIGDQGAPLTAISENDFVLNQDVLYIVASPSDGAPYRLLSITPDGAVTVEANNVTTVGLSGQLFGPQTGTSGADVLSGDDGNNTIIGGSGNDTLAGGGGIDTAGYSGAQGNYTLQITPTEFILEDRRTDADGRDTLTEFEFLDFAQGNYFDTGNASQTAFDLRQFADFASLNQDDFRTFIEIYIAYFNRAPDAVGLFFWGSVLAKGERSVEEIAEEFFGQPETQTTYPDLSDNRAFASEVYQNVLGRDFDEAGLNFWVDLLDRDVITQGRFILDVLDGVDATPGANDSDELIAQRALDAAYLENKTDLGLYFSVILGMTDVADARDTMALYDGSEAGFNLARDAMDLDYTQALNPLGGDFLMQLTGVFDDTITF